MSEEVEQAVKFLVLNRKKRPRDVARVTLQESLKVLEKASQEGLSLTHIDILANKIVFRTLYNLQVRRRLLFCLLPSDAEFPVHLVPLAVSDASPMNPNPVWQQAILTWLVGLLEYNILSPDDPDVRITYTAIFNLTSSLNLCGYACKLLTLLTVREDVTPYRALQLMRLKQKLGFFVPISQLLRVYQLFRPDLVAGELSDRRVVSGCPKSFNEALQAANKRRQEGPISADGMHDTEQIWNEITRAEKVNVYQRPTAVPQPKTYRYTRTLEEKKQKLIYVTQYRRFVDMVRELENHKYWQWPSNPASHLACPIIIPLFRPNDLHMQVNLTNWLEIALRTEVTSNLGNPGQARQESLIEGVLALSRVTAYPLPYPVINHFITEYITTGWNHRHGYSKVLQLLEHISYTSPEFLSDTLLKLIEQLTCCVGLMSWCRVVEAVTATASAWCILAHHQASTKRKVVQPQELFHEKVVTGLWYLTRRLEYTFKAAILNYTAHPLCLHHILDYYTKVNAWSEKLDLPLVFYPPVLVTLAIITSTDLTATHRLGRFLSSMRGGHERLRSFESSQDSSVEDLRLEELEALAGVNIAVKFFCGSLYTGKALGAAWRKELDQFYPFHFLDDVRQQKEAGRALSISAALSYLPFYSKVVLGDSEEKEEEEEETEPEDPKTKILAQLRTTGLTGVEECIREYYIH